MIKGRLVLDHLLISLGEIQCVYETFGSAAWVWRSPRRCRVRRRQQVESRPSRRRRRRAGSGPEGRCRDGRRRQGHGHARRHGAEERADQDERRPGLREGKHDAAVPGDLRRRQRRQVARQRLRLREGRPRQLRVRHADRRRRRSIRRAAAIIRTCSACASASRSRSSTATRRCTTSTRCRRPTRSSTTASRSRA